MGTYDMPNHVEGYDYHTNRRSECYPYTPLDILLFSISVLDHDRFESFVSWLYCVHGPTWILVYGQAKNTLS